MIILTALGGFLLSTVSTVLGIYSIFANLPEVAATISGFFSSMF